MRSLAGDGPAGARSSGPGGAAQPLGARAWGEISDRVVGAVRRETLAFMAGAVAGAAVALLYAPATGDETREYLGKRAKEGREKVVDAARQFRAAEEAES